MTMIDVDIVIEGAARLHDYLAIHGEEDSENSAITQVRNPRAKVAFWSYMGLTVDGAEGLYAVCVESTSSPAEAMAMWSGCQMALYCRAVADEKNIPDQGRKSIEQELEDLGGDEQ